MKGHADTGVLKNVNRHWSFMQIYIGKNEYAFHKAPSKVPQKCYF